MSLISTMMESSAIGQRPTIGRDLAQGVTEDPFVTILGTPQPGGTTQGVPCSVQQASSHIQQLYAQRSIFVDTQIHFAQEPGLEANDICIVTDRTGNTTNYLVQGKQQPVGRGRLWVLDATAVRAPV